MCVRLQAGHTVSGNGSQQSVHMLLKMVSVQSVNAWNVMVREMNKDHDMSLTPGTESLM